MNLKTELERLLIEVRPRKSFSRHLREERSFLVKHNRWCCTLIKTDPSKEYFAQHQEEPLLFLGNQQDENSYRYNYLPERKGVQGALEGPDEG